MLEIPKTVRIIFENSPSLPNPTLQTYTDFDIKLAKIARQKETAHPQPKFFSTSIGTLCTETAQVWMRTWKIQCTSGRYCGMGEKGCRARKPETECCDVMSELIKVWMRRLWISWDWQSLVLAYFMSGLCMPGGLSAVHAAPRWLICKQTCKMRRWNSCPFLTFGCNPKRMQATTSVFLTLAVAPAPSQHL